MHKLANVIARPDFFFYIGSLTTLISRIGTLLWSRVEREFFLHSNRRSIRSFCNFPRTEMRRFGGGAAVRRFRVSDSNGMDRKVFGIDTLSFSTSALHSLLGIGLICCLTVTIPGHLGYDFALSI